MIKNEDKGIHPAGAALTGAVIGAGVAVAGMALTDKKNREKVKDMVMQAKDKTMEYMDAMHHKKEEITDAVDDAKKEVKKMTGAAKTTARKKLS